MNLAVVARQLSGVKSGAHLAHLELAGFLEAQGHTVRYGARKGWRKTRHGKPVEIRGGYGAIRDVSAWADWTLVRDEPKAARVLRNVRGRVLYCVHSPAGAPPELGLRLPQGARIVYVSQAVRDAIEASHGPQPGTVIEGCPMDLGRYRTAPGDHVTLIDLSERKGGRLFWRLAEAMPDVRFLGVQLWGAQPIPDSTPSEPAGESEDVRLIRDLFNHMAVIRLWRMDPYFAALDRLIAENAEARERIAALEKERRLCICRPKAALPQTDGTL